MDDIEARLLALADEWFEMCGDIHEPITEAANTIAALRAEVERMREALYPKSVPKPIPRDPRCDLSALEPSLREEVIKQCHAVDGAKISWHCVDHNHACLRCQELARAALGEQP